MKKLSLKQIYIYIHTHIINFRKTYVPPMAPTVSEEIVANGSSQTATEAPKPEEKREARTLPLPAPIVKRLKSYDRATSTPFSESAEVVTKHRSVSRSHDSGFWDSIHELRSSISLTSESQFCFLMSFIWAFFFFLEVLAEEEEEEEEERSCLWVLGWVF